MNTHIFFSMSTHFFGPQQFFISYFLGLCVATTLDGPHCSNSKKGSAFSGQIANTYSSIIESPHHCIPKQLKDQGLTRNRETNLFNGINNHLYTTRLSGTDVSMLLEAAKENFHNKPSETSFEIEQMQHTLRHKLKWYARPGEDDSNGWSKRSRLNLDDNYRTQQKMPNNQQLQVPINAERDVRKLYRSSQRILKLNCFRNSTNYSIAPPPT